MSRPPIRSSEDLLSAHERRLGIIERRLVGAGALDLAQVIQSGPGIVITGAGTSVDPLVIASQYGVFRDDTPSASKTPFAYPIGYTISECAAGQGFPSTDGVVETVRPVGGRAYQRVTDRVTQQSWTRGALTSDTTWTAWETVGGDPVATIVSGAVSVAAGATVVAYTFSLPQANRERLVVVTAHWLMQAAISGGNCDVRIRLNGSNRANVRVLSGSGGSATPHTSFTANPNTAYTVDLQIGNGSSGTVSSNADATFYNLTIGTT